MPTSPATYRAMFRRTADDKVYVLTDYDVFMCAMILWGEKHKPSTSEKEASAILWSMINRYMLHPRASANWSGLGDMIKWFSQPLSPKWRLGGAGCPAVTTSGNCTADRLDWRRNMEAVQDARAWNAIPEPMRQFATRFSMGELPQLANSRNVDFASTDWAREHGTRFAGGEWFLTADQLRELKPQSPKWLPGTVKVAGVIEEEEGIGTGGWIVLGTWAFLTGWAMIRLLSKKK